MVVTQFYHTRDPIANLRVRVTVRKVAVGDSRDGDVAVSAAWTARFEWQEKKWPFRTIRKKNKRTPVSRDAVDTHAADDATQEETTDAHHGVALCSYVDADNYEPPPHGVHGTPTTSSAPIPHLVAAAADFHRSKTAAVSSRRGGGRTSDELTPTGTSNHDRVMLRTHREETFRQMHIVLRLSAHSSDDGDRADEKGEDLVLASLRYYPHTGLLCMTPGFSACIVDANDVHASAKGPKLSMYRVVSRTSGALFEYALDNENELWPIASSEDQRLLRELQRQEELEVRARLDEWRNKHGDADPVEAIATKAQREVAINQGGDQLMVLLEVVSVSGVDAINPIRVVVDLLMPEEEHSGDNGGGWSVCSGPQTSRTHLSHVTRSRGTGDLFAAFGHHTRFVLQRATEAMTTHTTLGAAPPLSLVVTSRDNWGREHLHGLAELRLPLDAGYTDTTIALWRPMLPPQAQMEAFFLGCDTESSGLPLTTTVATANTAKRYMTRLGSQAVSTSGRVRVRYHIVHSRPHLAVKSVAPTALLSPGGMKTHGGAVMKRSVEEILQAVKANQLSSAARGSGTLPPLPVPSASVTAILARLKDPSTRGTSPSAG